MYYDCLVRSGIFQVFFDFFKVIFEKEFFVLNVKRRKPDVKDVTAICTLQE